MFLVNVAGTDPCFRLDLPLVPEAYRVWMPHMGWNAGRMGNGLADYVFPWFLFIVGVAIPFSMRSGRGRGRSRGAWILMAFKRAALIYLLGTLLWMASIGYRPADPGAKWHGPIDWRVLLHWDILPLIGAGYFAGVLAFLCPLWARLAFVAGVLVFKWVALTWFVPEGVPGYREMLEAGRSLDHQIKRSLGWFGVLLTQGLAASSIVVIGTLVGSVIADSTTPEARRARTLALVGAGLSAAALAWWLLGDLPFSKDYFTPTYILITTGTGTLLLLAMWHAIDRLGLTTLTPLRVLGANALFLYILAELVWKTALVRWQVALPASMQPADASQPASSIAITAIRAHLGALTTPCVGAYLTVAGYILVYWLIARAMHARGWFVKV
jgi:predicted acyltransferase